MRKYIFFSIICLVFYSQSRGQHKILSAQSMSTYSLNVYEKYIDKLYDSLRSSSFRSFSDQFNSYETDSIGNFEGVYVGRYLVKSFKKNIIFPFNRADILGIKFIFWDQHINPSLTQITRIKILYRFKEPELESDTMIDLIEVPGKLFLSMLNADERQVISACMNYHLIADKDIKASPMSLFPQDFSEFSYNMVMSANIKFRNYIFNDQMEVYGDSLLEVGNTAEVVNQRYDEHQCIWFYHTPNICPSADTYILLYYHKFITNKSIVIHSFMPTICCDKNQVGVGWLNWGKGMKTMLEYEKEFLLYYIEKYITTTL